jgi:transcriptional regulator with XRE-family HTH domain
MSQTTSIDLKVAEKLKVRGYRHRFFARMAQDEIASRIRELRDLRKMRQADLAASSGMKQSAVSRIEQSGYAAWSFSTLLRVADALDVRLRVMFEPMEEVIREFEQLEASEHRASDRQMSKEGHSAFQQQERPALLLTGPGDQPRFGLVNANQLIAKAVKEVTSQLGERIP